MSLLPLASEPILQISVARKIAAPPKQTFSRTDGCHHSQIMKPIGKGMVWFVLLGELMLFLTVYHREISWCPPTNFDQAVYLDRSYLLQESVAHSGLQELLRPFVTGGHDNGIALPVEGALLGLFIGPARLARLFVGFIAFVLLQLCVYFSATRIWKNRSYGLVALGLVLSQSTAWFWAGGLFDYRIDFLAYCLFGIWTCLVLRSGMFHDRKWAIASALVGVLLVLNRFFTIIYLSGVLLGFGAALVVVWMFLGRGEPPELNLKKRYSNLAISSLILLAGTIPLLLLNAKAIYGYYVYPHLISGEQYVRAREFGVTDLSTNLAFYPKSIVLDHLGLFFLGAAAAVPRHSPGPRRRAGHPRRPALPHDLVRRPVERQGDGPRRARARL